MKKNTTYLKERIEKLFFNNPIYIFIWILVVFLSSIITITNGFGILIQKYNSTLGYKQDQYNKLSKLRTNVDINLYIEDFGKPTRIVSARDLDYKTYIFNNKYYYLYAVTNSDGAVFIFGVTTKTADFQPTFIVPNGQGKITLNKTSLYELSPEVIKINYKSAKSPSDNFCYGYRWTKRFGYYETHYLGNPGNYQTVIVGINDAGHIQNSQKFIDTLLSINYEGDNGIDCTKITENVRKEAIINTYRLTRPFFNSPYIASKSAGLLVGVDLDEQRVMEN